jgi:TRAP-type C4-dicarboxylate transport system substrate-binding protein
MAPSISLGTEEGWFVNEKAFNKLPADIKETVAIILEEEFYKNTIEYAFAEESTLGRVKKEKGVEVVTLSVEDQKKMSQVAVTVWDEVAKESDINAKAISILKDFLKDIGRL